MSDSETLSKMAAQAPDITKEKEGVEKFPVFFFICVRFVLNKNTLSENIFYSSF